MTEPENDAAASASTPTHIVILGYSEAPCHGSVVAYEVDLVSRLDVEGVAWRPATERDCRLAGIPQS